MSADALAERLRAVRTARFGCLANGCTETRATYPEIDAHMADQHPDIP